MANVDPNLAIRDRNGQIESVRYSAVNAMLLNEFLKEHKRVEDQARELRDQRTTIGELKENVATQTRIIAQQQKAMAAVTAQLKEQAAQIQKVSAQVELKGPAPQQVMSTP